MSNYSLVMNGDNNACAQWLNYAVGQLHGLLARKTPTSLFLTPTQEVLIQIYTMPNKIIITVTGGVFVTLADQNSASGAYYQPAVWPFNPALSAPSYLPATWAQLITPNIEPFQNEDGRLLVTDIATQKSQSGIYAGGAQMFMYPEYLGVIIPAGMSSPYISQCQRFKDTAYFNKCGVRYLGVYDPQNPPATWPKTLHQDNIIDCGGYWYSGSKAISWKGVSLVQGVIYPGETTTYNITGDYSLYIGGRWCKLDIPKTMLIAGCAILPNTNELQATWPLAGTNGYKYLVGVLMYEGNVGLISYIASTISVIYDEIVEYPYDNLRQREFYFLLLGVLDGDTPDTFKIDLINGGNGDQVTAVTPDMELSYVTAFSASGLCSGFASDGRTVAIANIDDNWYQTVDQYQFTPDYTAVGYLQLASDPVATVGVTYDGSTGLNHFTDNPGVPPIIAIRAEDKGFIVCRNNFSFTGTSSAYTHTVTLDVATIDTTGYTVAYTLQPITFDTPGDVVYGAKMSYVRYFSVKFGACIYGYGKIKPSGPRWQCAENYYYEGDEHNIFSVDMPANNTFAAGPGYALSADKYMAPDSGAALYNPLYNGGTSNARFPGSFSQDCWAANDKVLVYCWSAPQWDDGLEDAYVNMDGSNSGTLMLDITVGATHKGPVIYDYRIDRSLATDTAFNFYPLAVTMGSF